MQIYYLKQVAFEIVLSDAQLKKQVDSVKKALASIKGAGVDIKLNVTKAQIESMRKKIKSTLDSNPISVSIKGTDKLGKNGEDFNKGIGKAVVNMQKFLDLMQKASAESANIRNNLGSSGGGSRGRSNAINGGSRTGFTDSGGAQLSAFSGFIRGGQSFTSQIGAYASGIGRLGISAALPVAVIAGIVRGFRDAVGAITEFGDKQAQLAAILGTTRDGISSLTEQAKSLGATMAFTASEIAGAQIELAKLGFTSDEVLSSTEGVARFAIVAGANIPEAAEAAGAALKSFELEATEMDRVVSVLGVSTAKSALDFEKLKVGIGTTFATAKTFGLEIEDVTALLGELSNRGLSASVSATATRNILLNLADGEGKLRKTLANLGVKEVKGLDGIISALRTLNAQGVDLATTFELTDKRSVNAFNSFLRGTKDLTAMRDSLIDVNDEFKIMEKERLSSLKGETILFTSAIERLNLQMGGLENVLQGALSGVTGLVNAFSDFLELAPGEAVAKEGENVTNLIKSLISANDNYALKSKLIAQLKISYPDLIKDIDLERATVGDLNKLLEETTKLYDKKVNISIGETEFERAVKRENEALEKQAELLQKRQGADAFDILVTNPLLDKTKGDAKAARESALLGITTQVASTGFASLDQEKYLRDVIGQQPKGRGSVLTGDAKTASTILKQIGILRNSVAQDVPQFTDSDFAIPNDGQLSKVEAYLEKLENQRKLYKSNSVQADELSKAIKRVEEVIEKRRKPGNIEVIGKRGSGGKSKDPAKEGSIDYLEERAAYFTKQIDATPDESLRNGLQQEAEKFKKLVKEARAKLKADLEPTDEERIKLYNNFVDAQKDSNLRANEERFKDERLRSAVDLEIIKEAELKKLELRAFYQKKAFDDGTDKSGEYLNTLQDIENKKVEIVKAGEARVLVVGEISREMEVNERLSILRKIYTNEEDFGKAKEGLFLELEAAKIKAAVATGKVLSLVEQERLDGILDKITKINTELGSGAIAQSAGLTANSAFNSAFGAANKDGKISPDEIEKLNELEIELEFKKNETILKDKIARTKLDTTKRAAAERELNELILNNQKTQYENKERKEKEFWDIIKQGADIAGQISSELFNYQKQEQQARADSELETIDTIYEARLKAAEGNAAETERIEQEYQATKKAAEKKAAEERRQIAIKEAIVNLALAILKAAPNLVLMGVAAVVGGIQIATIRRQKFARGGHTGQGYGSPDETGEVPAGIVHADEYVIPKWQVRKNPSLIRSLESDRLRGYATGGLVASSQQGGFNYEAMAMMADIIASKVGQSVLMGSMKGTEIGAEMGTGKGINKAARETASRDSATKLNTF